MRGSPGLAPGPGRSPSERPFARACRASPGRRRPFRRGRAATRSCSRRTCRRVFTESGTSAAGSRVGARSRSGAPREGFQLPSVSSHMSFASSTRVCIGSSPHTACISSSCVQSAGAAAGRVSLGHVANQPVGLCADLELIPLSPSDEHEPSLVRVVAQARRGAWSREDRLGDRDRARCLRVPRARLNTSSKNRRSSRSVTRRARRSRHRRGMPLATVHPLECVASPEVGPVDAAAVDDRPHRSPPVRGCNGCAGDEEFGVRLQSDVIGVGKAAHRHPRHAGQRDVGQRVAVRAEDDDLRSPPRALPVTSEIPSTRLSHVHGSASFSDDTR